MKCDSLGIDSEDYYKDRVIQHQDDFYKGYSDIEVDNKSELYLQQLQVTFWPSKSLFYIYYTVSALSLAAILIGISYLRLPELLGSFLVSYIFILIPFFIINGILTGSFILNEIVWYNDSHNLGLRIGTIPFEDIFYGFSLLFLPLYIDQEIRAKKT